jgi:hypothetical protein
MLIRGISAGLTLACLALTPAYAAQPDKPPKPAKTHTAPKPKPKPHTAKAHTAPKTHTAHAKANTAHANTAKPHPAGNPVARSIEQRPWLGSRVGPLLPSGMSVSAASSGFRSDDQFLGALHASRNLNIPFVTLKDAMTGSNPVSLGQAIHVLRPSVDASGEASRAERQATSDLHR